MITVTVGEWRARWTGGRLADVFHASDRFEEAVDCFQVGAWDGNRGELLAEPTRATLRARLVEWVTTDGPSYLDNVVRYR